jgi:ribosomal protein L11 methyltransferase
MKWIEVSVTTNELASEILSEFLMEKGANGTEIVDAKAFKQTLEESRYLDYADDGLAESYGPHVVVRAYYPEGTDPEKLLAHISQRMDELSRQMDTGPAIIRWQMRDDTEWKDNWKAYFKPFQFTDRIVIKPSWEEYQPQAGQTVIELDPGMAFGTGTHETTRMCAVLGERYLKPGDRVLDLGCGTAILSLVAAKLGAGSILAVDIDEAAVRTAKQNVINNHEAQRIEVRRGVLSDIYRQPFDLIMINIIADVILSLTDAIRGYTHENTRIILSGIIKSRRDDVVSAWQAMGFRLMEEEEMGEWVALVFYA